MREKKTADAVFFCRMEDERNGYGERFVGADGPVGPYGKAAVIVRADRVVRPYERLSNCAYNRLRISSGSGAAMWRNSFVKGCRSHSS